MKLLIVAAVSLLATAALAHEAPPATKPATAASGPAPKEAMKPVKAHSGGTDARGCHTNHTTGEYHCHNPK